MKVKSVGSSEAVYLRFVNKTTRDVDVIWLNYDGQPVKYCGSLAPDQYFDVKSFVNHPWIFKDSNTGDELLVNNEDVFFPPCLKTIIRNWYPDAQVLNIHPCRFVVIIKSPMYKLRKRCLQVVRDCLNISEHPESIHELGLPKSVEDDLVVMLEKKYKYCS